LISITLPQLSYSFLSKLFIVDDLKVARLSMYLY